jgi:hypothetical protein
VPIYNGEFRVVQADVVLADIDRQVEGGARHITFGDPDFFNGPVHAIRIVEGLHRSHPEVTYDVTIKIEHLLRHASRLAALRDTGCLFVTSAVESLDDRVLGLLQKGHTRADFVEAVELCRAFQLTLVPTFVAFHPWTTRETYLDLLETVDRLDLVPQVAPIQLAIRLLIPRGSRMLEIDEVSRLVAGFDDETLTYRWHHPDATVDTLHRDVARIVGAGVSRDRPALFEDLLAATRGSLGIESVESKPARDRATVPYLDEPWYC